MPVDEKLQIVWNRQIKSRLNAILLHTVPVGMCTQELMMTGKRIKSMKPTLVISCGDKVTKKRVKKTVKSQTWLNDLLKSNRIMSRIIVSKRPLGTGLVSNDTAAMDRS